MGFVPPLNLGGFQPSPATLAQWVYQIWQYLQENPIATQEQLQEYIGTFITTSPTVQEMIGEGVNNYLVDNPPAAPVQSVQSKTGAVVLSYPDIVPASNAVPVYRASSVPSTNTLVGQYNLGYRLFVNTATQEIFTISPAGALSLVGRGKLDGTTIDLNSAQGDTTIAEKISELESADGTTAQNINALRDECYTLDRITVQGEPTTIAVGGIAEFRTNIPTTLPKIGILVGTLTTTGGILSSIFVSNNDPDVYYFTIRNFVNQSITVTPSGMILYWVRKIS